MAHPDEDRGFTEEALEAGVEVKTSRPSRISVSMIARRNLSSSIASGPSEDLVHHLLKLTHVRLDRENIGEIDNLEVLGPVTNLYLQQNLIKTIENLESLENLRFLTLAGNQIQQIEKLLMLDKLQFLDLSQNKIAEVDVDELPKSLVILDLSDNPCCSASDYQSKLHDGLPNLRMLDKESVFSSSDEDDEEDEEKQGEGDQSYHKALDDVLQFSADLIKQSHERIEDYKKVHETHMNEIEETRNKSGQASGSETGKTPDR